MDRINFLAKDDFPASSETLDRLQQATNLVSTLALLGGDSYILKGCDDKGGIIQPGTIILDGEILPFRGGAPLEYIVIEEKKETLEAFDELYPEAYIDRVVVFASEGKVKWGDIAVVTTIEQLEAKFNSLKGEAPGFIKDWSGLIERLPSEYRLCDGGIINTEDYPDLAYYYGKENDVSFKIPDLRGKFIAGFDNSKIDYNEIGKEGGGDTVTLEKENYPKHRHVYSDDINARNGFPTIETGFPILYDASVSNTSAKSEGTGAAFYTTYEGGDLDGNTKPHENRPAFYVLAKVIRVKF